MKGHKFLTIALVTIALLLLALGGRGAAGLAQGQEAHPRVPLGTAPAAPLGTGFTYQGMLLVNGEPISGTCAFQFALWNDPITGTLVAGPLEQTGVPLAAGRFTVLLDFGAVFDGTALWLAIAAQCPGDPGYVPLTPRQALTAAPYAQAVSWYGVYDMPEGFADGEDNDTLYDAGTGLALAGTTFSITPTYRLPQDPCAGGQVAKWDGAAWTCADDIFSIVVSGTNIFAGEGLYAVTQSNSITLNVFFGGNGSAGSTARSDHDHAGIYAPLVHTHAGEDITSGTVADARIAASIARDAEITPTVWANDGAGSGLDADLLDGLHGSAYQLQVSGTCAVGSTIRAINADGTVVCEAHDARPVFSRTTLDSIGVVGDTPSLAMGTDGLGLISYFDNSADDLKVAHCSDTACTGATITTLDSAGAVGQDSALAIGVDGLGLISYYDIGNGDLKVAHCLNTTCSAATITTLDSAGDVGQLSSIAIGADGLGLIGYYAVGNGDLKVAHCSNATCSAATITTLDTTGIVGQYSGVAIGVDGLGLISYLDRTNWDLKVAHCSNMVCSTATLATVDSSGDAGVNTSIIIGADGLGLIAYTSTNPDNLRVVHCSNTACTVGTITVLDVGWVGNGTAVMISADSLGLIAYYDAPNEDLQVAHCSNTTCTAATLTTLDDAGTTGYEPSVALGTDGLALISYFDAGNGDLRVAHCSNAFCVPYWRQR